MGYLISWQFIISINKFLCIDFVSGNFTEFIYF